MWRIRCLWSGADRATPCGDAARPCEISDGGLSDFYDVFGQWTGGFDPGFEPDIGTPLTDKGGCHDGTKSYRKRYMHFISPWLPVASIRPGLFWRRWTLSFWHPCNIARRIAPEESHGTLTHCNCRGMERGCGFGYATEGRETSSRIGRCPMPQRLRSFMGSGLSLLRQRMGRCRGGSSTWRTCVC